MTIFPLRFCRICILYVLSYMCVVLLTACENQPYPRSEHRKNIYYSDFSDSPKTLDPAQAYEEGEIAFIAQIYEPPLQYDFVRRPYTLVPLTAATFPEVEYLSASGQHLAGQPSDPVAFTRYTIHIKPGIYYAPHPAFAYKGQSIQSSQLDSITKMEQFHFLGTRELIADDYIYEIKRLASTRVGSPIFSLMAKYIVGLNELQKTLMPLEKKYPDEFIDLRKLTLSGVKKIDNYTYQITIQGHYPQFVYWLAMPFFAPIPWEADRFYHLTGMKEHNLTLDWFPIGTGPYYMTEHDPNRRIELTRNPRFHGELFPETPPDALMHSLSGKPLPFLDKVVFSLERESIPRWNKFLQGYYDESGIPVSSFNQSINIGAGGVPTVTPPLAAKGIHLRTAIAPDEFFLAFNMLDPVVGGNSERAKKLRQAISIIFNVEEFIALFMNGRAEPAHSPIPPGIFGYRNGQEGMNPIVYNWNGKNITRKSVAEARQLMREAGYPNGIDPKSGQALVINYDAVDGGPEAQYEMSWLRRQFAQIGIALNVQSTQVNRYYEKMQSGTMQLFMNGWNADYPDPENFLFLFYSQNGKKLFGGENVTNYSDPAFDRDYLLMRLMPNSPARQALIDRMVVKLREDSPVSFGFFPRAFTLAHAWVAPFVSNPIANNILKYKAINPEQREALRTEWNQPSYWPILLVLGFFIVLITPMIIQYWRDQHGIPHYPELPKEED